MVAAAAAAEEIYIVVSRVIMGAVTVEKSTPKSSTHPTGQQAAMGGRQLLKSTA